MSRLLVLLLVACGGTEATPEPAPEPEPAPAPAPAPPPEPEMTPQSLYEACMDRVEKPQAEAECESDDQCTKAGASGEVCTTTEAAAELMTTAEVKQCFKVLDTCGCHEGQCTWTLKDEIPKGGGGAQGGQPGMLPPSKGKKSKRGKAAPQ